MFLKELLKMTEDFAIKNTGKFTSHLPKRLHYNQSISINGSWHMMKGFH